MRRAAFLGVLALACAEPAAPARAPVVYEEDGRTEVFAHPNAALRAVAETAVAMKIDPDFVDDADPRAVRIDYTRTLGEAKTLCDGERFADQIEPGTCSGTLIDAQHLLTAGHCVDTPADCSDAVWVFGFRYAAEGALARLTADDVYACARVLAYFDDDRVDHAVVELDRPVVGHAPATTRIEPSGLAVGTPLALIGHPNGIPMKIDDGATVTWNAPALTHLRAPVDAFNGNSGSGVFDHEGRLVALLRGGEDDYVDAGGCNVVNVIDPVPAEDGEGLTYLRPAIDAYCAVPGVDSPLCACDGPCVPAPAGDACADAVELEAVDQTVRDTLAGYGAGASGSCGGEGPDRVYAFTLTEPVSFTARTAGFDSVLYLRDACDGFELACNDDIDTDTDRGSRVTADLAPGRYVLFVDAYDADIDAFTLTLSFGGAPPPADAGAVPSPDAGGPDPAADGGTAPPPSSDGGCASVGAPRTGIGGACLLALALGLVGRRRRRGA